MTSNTNNSEVKKRKSEDEVKPSAEKKKTLFILEFEPMRHPIQDNMYAIFTSGENVEVYDKLCKQLQIDMKSAARGWHDVADAERVWVPWMMFLNYVSKYDASKNSGYHNEEDYQKTRNQKARMVMLAIGMIQNMADLTSDEVGKDFIKEEIGEFKIVSKRDMMEVEKFDMVLVVPDICNRECQKYYNKL